MLTNSQKLYLKKNWIFQQDSTPSHQAKTQAWLHDNGPKLIKQEAWSHFSLDLNPLDNCIWGILESKVNVTWHKCLDSQKLPHCMIEANHFLK